MLPSFTLRLAAAGVAAVAVLPVLPAHADAQQGGRPSAVPAARTLDRACPADRVDGAQFSDAASSAHGPSISCLSWYGVTQGGADGSFGVDRAVSRAQLATFLTRVLSEAGVELPASAPDAFSDDEGSPHEASLDALAALGVVSGSGDGSVSPDKAVRRDQMAAFLVRLLELIEDEELAETVEDYFSDDDDNVHRGPINALAGLGIAAGRAQGIFDPSSEVRRDQMATFLARLIDRLVEHGDVRVPLTLRLSAEEVAPGDVVQAEVLGDGITAVELVGCGFDGVVTDADAEADGVQFALTVPAAWPVEGEDEPVSDAPGATETADAPMATETGEADEDVADPREDAGEAEEECEFVVTVTLEDGSVEELEGELSFTDAEDASGDPSDEAGGDASEGEGESDQPEGESGAGDADEADSDADDAGSDADEAEGDADEAESDVDEDDAEQPVV